MSVLAALLITIALSKPIAPAVRQALTVAVAITNGKLDNNITPSRRAGADEVAKLLQALHRMQEVLRGNLGEAAANATAKEVQRLAERERGHCIDGLVRGFQASAAELARALNGASGAMTDSARSLTSVAGETGRKAGIVAVAASQANDRTIMLAAATEDWPVRLAIRPSVDRIICRLASGAWTGASHRPPPCSMTGMPPATAAWTSGSAA